MKKSSDLIEVYDSITIHVTAHSAFL